MVKLCQLGPQELAKLIKRLEEFQEPTVLEHRLRDCHSTQLGASKRTVGQQLMSSLAAQRRRFSLALCRISIRHLEWLGKAVSRLKVALEVLTRVTCTNRRPRSSTLTSKHRLSVARCRIKPSSRCHLMANTVEVAHVSCQLKASRRITIRLEIWKMRLILMMPLWTVVAKVKVSTHLAGSQSMRICSPAHYSCRSRALLTSTGCTWKSKSRCSDSSALKSCLLCSVR